MGHHLYFTPEAAKSVLPRYEYALEEERKLVNLLKSQIADIQKSSLKRRRSVYGVFGSEEFQKELTEWREPILAGIEREVSELKLIIAGWTWEQIVAQRKRSPEDETEPTLF
ncbi:hypothetical protein [Paenibacillus hunanensis]|uniref:Uncharacterized protein n=1 Tax=Paenibacillus hunanensis TaxID=539262 RepID=A0ABU1IW67_9BACL|nr:hypothetical protein [Paenibacillus hunanensis]MDR6243506.1 hypothetical protein [Paenibacillus hunanensis]GGI98237.1 hypothetical protein GCM10008022_03690 [Paenibacillus hunanensis]